MGNQLPIPPELQHLIEKREGEDPRQTKRRSDEDRRGAEPTGDADSIKTPEEAPVDDRRSASMRREDRERREEARRQSDPPPEES